MFWEPVLASGFYGPRSRLELIAGFSYRNLLNSVGKEMEFVSSKTMYC